MKIPKLDEELFLEIKKLCPYVTRNPVTWDKEMISFYEKKSNLRYFKNKNCFLYEGTLLRLSRKACERLNDSSFIFNKKTHTLEKREIYPSQYRKEINLIRERIANL